jgi:DNA-directed RNA polymerase specialized sigma24 family protein
VVLRYYLDRTEAETAAALGCSVGMVKSQNVKALRHLREHLGVAAPARTGLPEGIA